MPFEGLSLFHLTRNFNIKPFDCDDEDLNDFLMSQAKDYQTKLLGVTHIIENNVKTVAYFTLFNDVLEIQQKSFASKSAFKRFISGLLPHGKRHLTRLPALKIGRLAVCKDEKSNGLGKQIVNYIISLALTYNETVACKIITVDAYAKSLIFYEKMGFVYFSEADKADDTRQMYLDLEPFLNTVLN